MPTTQVLLVESGRASATSYAAALEKRGYSVTVERTAPAALKRTHLLQPDVVVLNAASLKTSGARMCRQLKARLNGTPILLIADKKCVPDSNCGAATLLVAPFTARKLLNGVARLLPADESKALKLGPIRLNLEQQKVSCGGREERVTPKQARLLEMFMRSPGQLLTRKAIIKHVWDTDYTGDTRTLDVHMSWLRSVIEPNPRKPRYLKTLRGQGYRLDVSPER
jgi:DNA-binding response OmpR family regulator